MAAANASPCLERDLNTRIAAFATRAIAAHTNDAVIVLLWLLFKICCESLLAQAACVALLRNSKMHTPPVVMIAEATCANQKRLKGIST
jgi:hypothetical protein